MKYSYHATFKPQNTQHLGIQSESENKLFKAIDRGNRFTCPCSIPSDTPQIFPCVNLYKKS